MKIEIILSLCFAASMAVAAIIMLSAFVVQTLVLVPFAWFNFVILTWPLFFFVMLFAGVTMARKHSGFAVKLVWLEHTLSFFEKMIPIGYVLLIAANAMLLGETFFGVSLLSEQANAITKITFIGILFGLCHREKIDITLLLLVALIAVLFFLKGQKGDFVWIGVALLFKVFSQIERFDLGFIFFLVVNLIAFFVISSFHDDSLSVTNFVIRVTGNAIHFVNDVNLVHQQLNYCGNLVALFPFFDHVDALQYYDDTIRPLSTDWNSSLWWDSVSLYERLIHLGCGSLYPFFLFSSLFFFLGYLGTRVKSAFPLMLATFMILTSYDGMLFYDVLSFVILVFLWLLGAILFLGELFKSWKEKDCREETPN